MSLTIIPQISSVGFAHKYHSVKPQSHSAKSINTQEDLNGQVFSNQTESNAAKIISKDNKASSENIDLASAEKKIRVRIDPKSKEVHRADLLAFRDGSDGNGFGHFRSSIHRERQLYF